MQAQLAASPLNDLRNSVPKAVHESPAGVVVAKIPHGVLPGCGEVRLSGRRVCVPAPAVVPEFMFP